jgi:hypothetical protein
MVYYVSDEVELSRLRCGICGRAMGEAKRPTRRYCSDVCRQQAHRLRVSTELEQAQAEITTLRARVAELEAEIVAISRGD